MATGPCFAMLAPDNPGGLLMAGQYRERWRHYRQMLANMEFATTDIQKLGAMLAISMPTVSAKKHRRILGFIHRIETQLKRIAPFVFEQGILSDNMIMAVEAALQDMPANPDAELVAAVEGVVIEKLTPTHEYQELPSGKAIASAIQDVLESYKVIGTEIAKREIKLISQPAEAIGETPGMWAYSVVVDKTHKEVTDRHLAKLAKINNITVAEAAARLLTGELEGTKVTIFGFGVPDENSPLRVTHMPAAGKLSRADQHNLRKMRVVYRDINEVAALVVDRHDPTPEQRALIQLRDGECRFPECRKPATKADIDHVDNYEDGGPTSVANLQCLCREHHNLKTDRKITATITQYGVVSWWDTNNQENPKEYTLIGTTRPQGPLAGIQGVPRSSQKLTPKALEPPNRNGMGRWGMTYDSMCKHIHQERSTRRTLPQLKEANEQPPF